jgi:hypothetical protein
MRGVMYAPGEVRAVDQPEPRILKPTDAAEGYRVMDERPATKVLLRS